MKIRKDDTVIVVAGKDKGKTGKVLRAFPREHKVIVEGVNIQVKHQKPMGPRKPGGLVKRESKIDVSNVMFYDSSNKRPTRLGYKFLEDGTKVRFRKSDGEVID
ncbi:MAG: 50S ribosomal protein L24 [Tissierellia bacterium]|nr:50S ribosomal protein L24 [Tissierellia bacterium]